MSTVAKEDLARIDADTQREWRHQIARLPPTMQPALNGQVENWDDLFPFEQRRTRRFLFALCSFQDAELNALTGPLCQLEQRMNIAHSSFSVVSETMGNAALLARSPYYAQWRREVQRVFSAIESRASSSVDLAADAGRLIVIILPDTLPIASLVAPKPWDQRGIEYRVAGDVRRIAQLALEANSGLPSLLAAKLGAPRDPTAAGCWLIDADAQLGTILPSIYSASVSLLQYSALKSFKDRFLKQVNTVPKDIEGTDQILVRMRHEDWSAWWPASLAGENRLLKFVIELFLSGNGALIFPNSFVQWAAAEAIRRARPRLLVARFGMRSKPKPFTGIAIFENQQKVSALQDVDDPEGSAVDALILARYIWLAALRYPEAHETSCICIGERSRSVCVIASDAKRPAWPADTAVTPEQIHEWMQSSLA